MITIKRTHSRDLDFVKLVGLLDAELKIRDGKDHGFYAQFNGIENLPFVILAYSKDKVLGCGAIKEYNGTTMEIKRMFVRPKVRARGIASKILKELERWTLETGRNDCILETGLRQPEAIALYKKNGYQIIPNYGQYIGMSNSVCFLKKL